MGSIGLCRHLANEQDFPFDGICGQMSLPCGKKRVDGAQPGMRIVLAGE